MHYRRLAAAPDAAAVPTSPATHESRADGRALAESDAVAQAVPTRGRCVVVGMDPWLSQRYAGVSRATGSRTASTRAPAPSRRARRAADHLLDGLARELRVRRARRRALAFVVATCAALGVAWIAHDLGLLQ